MKNGAEQVSRSGTDAAGGCGNGVLGRRFRFGEFVIDVEERSLTRDGIPISVQPKTFDLLAYLVTHAAALRTKQQLLDEIWPGMVVTENSLSRSIHQLRTALDDAAEKPRFVETVPRAGYRFIGDVRCVDEGPGTAQSRPSPPARLAIATAAALVLLAVLYWLTRPEVALEQAPSIAVLPFVNMSADPENEFFSDGISEEILNELSTFRELRVMSRTSSFAFKDVHIDVPTLSELLGVRYLLQGSVRKQGSQLRITAQLVSHEGAQIWSSAYDRKLGAIFDVQQDIARTVAVNIAPRLQLEPSDVIERRPNIDAYQHFLVGREILQERLPHSSVRARDELVRAIELDPQFAEAYAELAAVQVMSAGSSDVYLAEMQAAQRNIDTALSLNPQLARAHAVQGLLLRHLGDPQRRDEAEASLRRALDLAPNMVDAHNWLASIALDEGNDMAEGVAAMENAARIDPLAPAVITNLAMLHAERGETQEGERRMRRILALPQPPWFAYATLGEIQWQTGRLVEAVDSAKRLAQDFLIRSGSGKAGRLGMLSECYARLGLWKKAYYWQAREERDWPEYYRVALKRSVLLRLEGRHAEAITHVDQLLAGRGLTLDVQPPDLLVQYGTLQALSGDPEGARRTLEAVPWSAIGSFSMIRTPEHADGRQALAWAYLRLGRTAEASALLEYLEQRLLNLRNQGFLRLASHIFALAQNDLLSGNHALALDRLEEAIEAGWRDQVVLAGDVRWDAVRGNLRFDALMTRVGELVDAERRLVEETDAEEDFATRLDQLIAAQK